MNRLDRLRELRGLIEMEQHKTMDLLGASAIRQLQEAVSLLIEDRLTRLRRVHRDARSGRFISAEEAADFPERTVTEKR